jgi:hypothetical protein
MHLIWQNKSIEISVRGELLQNYFLRFDFGLRGAFPAMKIWNVLGTFGLEFVELISFFNGLRLTLLANTNIKLRSWYHLLRANNLLIYFSNYSMYI